VRQRSVPVRARQSACSVLLSGVVEQPGADPVDPASEIRRRSAVNSPAHRQFVPLFARVPAPPSSGQTSAQNTGQSTRPWNPDVSRNVRTARWLLGGQPLTPQHWGTDWTARTSVNSALGAALPLAEEEIRAIGVLIGCGGPHGITRRGGFTSRSASIRLRATDPGAA